MINSIRNVAPVISMQDPGRHLAQVCLHIVVLITQPRMCNCLIASAAGAHMTVASASNQLTKPC